MPGAADSNGCQYTKQYQYGNGQVYIIVFMENQYTLYIFKEIVFIIWPFSNIKAQFRRHGLSLFLK